MKRRNFIKNTSLISGSLMTLSSGFSNTTYGINKYNLNYAPHFGMFKNIAGNDLIDQLKFMHDQGFMAIEDNGMKGKKIELQNKISSFLVNNNMQMGVFVAHKIYWNKPNLASGDPNRRKEFLKEILQIS